MPIVVIGLSHHSSSVTLRERFAFAEARIPTALQSLRHSGIADEAVILSTCNRVEIYATTTLEPRQAFAALQHGHTGSRLNKAFQRAFNVAKQVRTETDIQRGSVSVGSVAVELAEKIFSGLNDRDVMVI